MIIERDLPIKMDDGVTLRVNVYRPDTKKRVPVVMAGGPYGKGVKYQEHYKPLWESLLKMHPDLLSGSKHRWLTWETVDPEIWVPWGYACVRVDSRGAGRSPEPNSAHRPAYAFRRGHWPGRRMPMVQPRSYRL